MRCNVGVIRYCLFITQWFFQPFTTFLSFYRSRKSNFPSLFAECWCNSYILPNVVRTTRDCERTGGTICNQPKFWTKNLATLLLNQLCTVSETSRLEFEIKFADASQNLGRIVSTLCLNSGNFPAKYSSLLDDPNPKYKDLLNNRLQVPWLVKRNIFLSRSAEYRSPLVSVIENMYFLKPVSG
jgi:hypothetical protein